MKTQADLDREAAERNDSRWDAFYVVIAICGAAMGALAAFVGHAMMKGKKETEAERKIREKVLQDRELEEQVGNNPIYKPIHWVENEVYGQTGEHTWQTLAQQVADVAWMKGIRKWSQRQSVSKGLGRGEMNG